MDVVGDEKMGKAIFFDIDGTLVNFRGEMPESTRDALRKVQENGHRIILCSGRSRFQIYTWLLEIEFDGIVGAAGAYVECNGQAVFEHHMGKEALITVQTLLERVNACYAAQTKNGIVMTADARERMVGGFHDVGLKEDMTAQVWKNVQIDEQMEQRRDIEKLFFFNAKESVVRIQELLSEYCDVVEMSFGRTNNNSGEISSRGINKAFGMQKYLEYAGIAIEDTIAFGDGSNDFEMLEYAQVGVAMGNALDALKKRADYVTSGIDEGGIARALEALGLL